MGVIKEMGVAMKEVGGMIKWAPVEEMGVMMVRMVGMK